MTTLKTIAATTLLLGLAGCSGGAVAGDDPASSTPGSSTASTAPPVAAQASEATPPAEAPDPNAPLALIVNVRDGASDVPVSTLLQVTATAGRVTDVEVGSTASGKNAVPVTGQVDDKGVWTAKSRLDPGASYTVEATATGDDGSTKTSTTRFTTAHVARRNEVFPTLTPVHGGPFGVAQPVVIHFDTPVKNKAEFERNMHVTSIPAQEGSWGWFDDKTVHWRPRTYWKPGTKVTLDANLNGADAGNGRYGQLNRTLELTIGKDQQGKVDVAKHTITWLRDDKPIGTWPMTAGKPGFTTRSGTKVVMEKAENITMNSETTGIAQDSAEGYEVKAALAMRVTSSGEFIHSAPWNEGNFGVRNASHGCVGMSEDTMYAAYTAAQIGDPVVFTGTNRKVEFGNGWSEWDLSWEQWKAKSALR